jgi:hypothetical protein
VLANGGQKINGRYQLWFHAGDGNFSDIYHAYSTDAQNWTVSSTALLGWQHNTSTYEKQQAADPAVVEVNGVTYLFYDGVDNDASAGYINVATFPGTVANAVLWDV